MAFLVSPKYGEAACPRCRRKIYRAPSKKRQKLVTVDERPGVYSLEEAEDGTIVAAWTGPGSGYAYHYNLDGLCASDEEAAEANDI